VFPVRYVVGSCILEDGIIYSESSKSYIIFLRVCIIKTKTNSVAFSPRANYTD
jgi:hypothetical protein